LTYAGKWLHNVGVVEDDAASGVPGDDALFKALADPTRRRCWTAART